VIGRSPGGAAARVVMWLVLVALTALLMAGLAAAVGAVAIPVVAVAVAASVLWAYYRTHDNELK
jgi:hypothetical protein